MSSPGYCLCEGARFDSFCRSAHSWRNVRPEKNIFNVTKNIVRKTKQIGLVTCAPGSQGGPHSDRDFCCICYMNQLASRDVSWTHCST